MYKSARKSITLLLFCCVMLVALGCNGQIKKDVTNDVVSNEVTTANSEIVNQKNGTNETSSAGYEIIKQTYTDRKVSINYPQVTGMSDNKKQEKINEVIKTEALAVSSGYSNLDNVTIKIDYEIKLQNAELLSIIYSGYRNPKGAAHPTNEFYTTNINMQEGNKLRLKDFINIDEKFVEKLKKEKLIANFPEHTLETIMEGHDTPASAFYPADLRDYRVNGRGVYSYFTNGSLGISIHVNHAIGDHVEVEVKYQDIVNNIETGNKIWKSLFK